ncbi:MAG: CBS domain-containing protein [Desulfobacteraceae bacterium]|nr:CBS domain-containing protein [Desulfobacteraceae bacterium]
MIVKNWMRKAVSVPNDATLFEAAKLMRANNSSWLPVVEKGHPVGTVSVRDFKRAIISDTPSLEFDDMLSVIPEIKVCAQMNKSPKSVLESRTIEEAADLLLDEEVSGMPVVDSEGRLKGIIEKQDILKALISLSGLPEKGLQVALELDNRPGSIAEVEEIVRSYGCRVLGIMSTFKEQEGFRRVYLRLCRCDRTRLGEMKKALRKSAKLLYVADFGEKKTDFYGEYEPTMAESYFG